jgi:hypothetical protein
MLKTDFSELDGKMRMFGLLMSTDTALQLKLMGDEASMAALIVTTQLAPALVKLADWIFWFIGRVEAIGSFLKAGTQGITMNGVIRSLMNPTVPIDFSTKGALKAAKTTIQNWDAMTDDLHKKIADLAAELKNPKHPFFDIEGGVEKSQRMKEGDSLIRVGNFLGSTGNAISRIETQKVQLLTGINRGVDKLVTLTSQEAGARGLGMGGNFFGAVFPP